MAKIFRNYNTLAEFNSESIHPENKICFIKDKGVQYSFYKMDTISNMEDSDNAVNKFNELRTNLLKSNLMKKKNLLYWTGPSNTISISGRSYTANPDKVTIDGVEYYQLIIDDSFNDDFCNFDSGTFTNLIFIPFLLRINVKIINKLTQLNVILYINPITNNVPNNTK